MNKAIYTDSLTVSLPALAILFLALYIYCSQTIVPPEESKDMAIIDHKGIIRGAVGPSVFRHSRGRSIVQSRPRKYKQTAASMSSAAEFGMISSTGAIIRHAFEPACRYQDGRAYTRVSSAVGRCVRSVTGTVSGERDLHDGDLSFLPGTEFNANSPLKDILKTQPRVWRDEGAVLVQLPALDMNTDLRLPRDPGRRGVKIRLRFLLVALNFRESYYEYVDRQELEFQLNQKSEAMTLRMSGDVPAGSLLLLSMSVFLYGSDTLDKELLLLNSKAFSPAALIGAWQEPGIIPLSQAAAAEGSEVRITVGYIGNQLLTDLPGRIRRKASIESAAAWLKKRQMPEARDATDADKPIRGDDAGFIKGRRVIYR